MGGLFGGKAPQSQKTQPIGALNVQSSVYGGALTLLYGQNRIPINLIHFVDFRAIPHTEQQQQGGKGAPKAPSNTTYTYQVAYAGALCFGEVAGVGTIWKNKERHTLSSLGYTLFDGGVGQVAWSYLTTNYPDEAVPYANTAYLANPAMELGDSPSLPNINAEVTGLVPFDVGTINDAEPSAILADYLGDPIHGAGFGDYLGDLDAFRIYCTARGLFLSPFEANQRAAGQFVKEIAEICNSAPVWKSTASGFKLELIPYGDEAITGNGETFTPDLTPMYALTTDDFVFEAGQDPVRHSAKPQPEAYNHVRVEFNDRSYDYNPNIAEAKDPADIDEHGLRTKAVKKATMITTGALARDVAQIQMMRDLYVRNFYSFRLGVRFSLLEPMDYLSITEPNLGLDNQLVRIVTCIERDDYLDLEVEEVNIGTASSPLFGQQPPLGGSQDFNVDPGDVEDPLIMNGAGLLTATGFEMWIAVAGLDPNWGGAVAWVSDDDITYRRVGMIMAPARYGYVTEALVESDLLYNENATFKVELLRGQLISGTQDDVDNWRIISFVGGEWISWRDATLVSGTEYELAKIRRAGYGSVADEKPIDATFAVIDEAIFKLPYDRGNIGKTVYFKFTSFNIFGGGLQDLADVVAWTHTIGASEITAPVLGDDGSVRALSIVSGVVTVDCATTRHFTLQLTANVTSWVFVNVPTGCTIDIEITQTGAFTVTPYPGWTYADGIPYVANTTVGAVDLLTLVTLNAGATWAATIVQQTGGGGGTSFVVTLSPVNAFDSGTMAASATITATPANGTSPYTYLWEYVSGAVGIVLSDTTTATVQGDLTTGGVYKDKTVTVRCTVTDNVGAVASAVGTINLICDGGGIPP